ncbi:MAG: hypothetical protein N2422_03640 [Rhodobacteraceae bacterium]|nr:hypothetical protein [Paracoccaceae bacterium]
MAIWQEWWVWITAGGILAILELILPGQVLLGFAAGAVLTGLLLAAGILGASWPVLLFVFAMASLAAWWVFRRVFRGRAGDPKIWHTDINDNP